MIPYLKIKNASFAYTQKKFFKDFNWTINQGENWIITGKIGVGKTSLVQALAGKYYLTQGQLTYPYLEATLPTIKSTYELKRKCVRLVSFKDDSRAFDPHSFFYSQRFNAFAADGTITVWEYLMAAGFSEYKKEHVDLIKRTGIFELLDLERIKLSSGQSRKLLVTKAILQQPKLLIIDNPYMGLDAKSRQEFNELLDDLVKNEGIQLVLAGQYEVLPTCVSHELELENFTIIYEGNVREHSFFKETTAMPLSFGKHSSPFIAKKLVVNKEKVLINNKSEIIDKVKFIFNKPNYFPDCNEIFSLKNATVAYYGKKILDNINWVVQPGEKWALFGANGSGKSTLLALLFGDHPQAYSNEIYLFGQKRGVGQNIWDIKKRTGYTSAELHFFFNAKLTAEETIITGLFDHVYLKRKPTPEEQQLVDLLMAYFEVTLLKNQPFQSLSTGEQRIMLLIRALVKNPPLILLDEPFQGFDLKTIQLAKDLLNAILSSQHTLVFITHYEREIPEIVEKRFVLR